MIFPFKKSIRSLVGSRSVWASQRSAKLLHKHPEKGISALISLAQDATPLSNERPIFIFSQGWRSGSTLMQRLVCSGKDTLIWGEPYDQMCIIQELATSLAPFAANWPNSQYYDAFDLENVSDRWIANLYPTPDRILRGYRALMQETFAAPAYAAGAQRWGIKEVRFGLAEALLLRGVFPNAKFVFIRRDLRDAFLSYKGFIPRLDWYAAWPNQQAATAYSFARHWARLDVEFPAAREVTGGHLVEYEDLTSGQTDLDALANYLELDIDTQVLANRVGSGQSRRRAAISHLEEVQLWLGKKRPFDR